jgi:hypothetical protein
VNLHGDISAVMLDKNRPGWRIELDYPLPLSNPPSIVRCRALIVSSENVSTRQRMHVAYRLLAPIGRLKKPEPTFQGNMVS